MIKVCEQVLEIIKSKDAEEFVFCEIYTDSVTLGHLLDLKNGLSIQLTLHDDYQHKKFKQSEFSRLFYQDKRYEGWEISYCIDFGNNCREAANIIYRTMTEVFELSMNTEVLCCIEMYDYDINIVINSDGELTTTKVKSKS